MGISQENRGLKLITPLGKDVLLVTGMDGVEGISVPFRYNLELISKQPDIEFDKIIGKSVNLFIVLADGDSRVINGVVTYFEKVDAGVGDTSGITFYPYLATITPSFWLLDFTGDCKIFQNITVPQIVEGIFSEHRVNFINILNNNYPTREYCVQYNESDFTFVSRLLEEEGIFYYFEHEENKHTLVLADTNTGFKPCPCLKEAKYRLSMEGKDTEDMIISFNHRQKLGPTKYAVADFNFKTPTHNMEAKSKALQNYYPNELEIFCYPGNSTTIKESMLRSEMRAQEEECHAARITGTSNCRSFASGCRFTLRQFYRDAMNGKDYYLVNVTHSASQSLENGASFHYTNAYACLPIEVKHRPMRTTHKPLMQGSQTATVTGPKGQEIYVDKHGRVKVQFHWDRYGQKDENTSCWIRVSYPSASKGFGFQSHPRIGDEVIVDFLEGDPDRPIITGAVYNAANPTPYTLPDNKTRSTMKSNSSIGGGGYNEFRFEDLKGSEEVYLQGEKDWNILIKNDKGQKVGHDETLSVGNNRTKTVGVDQTVRIGANHTETIGANKKETVTINRTESVGANHTETIGANKTESVGANKTETVASSKTETVGSSKTETVSINKAETIGLAKELSIGGMYQVSVGGIMNETVIGAKTEEVGGYKAVGVGMNHTETVGETYSLSANEVVIEAPKITFSTGKATITMTDNGNISISGNNIVIKGKKITEN